ncbi:uncharacterized protein LOC143509986 [Brachyhypopomus gauderio]|uniref:uncharacterized protein LOC143509986 n=1 Tax=Brachyhypopomus gauderio TaxID=698409 RepID=UPI0040416632
MKGFSVPLLSMVQLHLISNVFSPVSPVTPVKVNLHDAATLPCSQTCSDLVTWTVLHKPRDILAQCNQTSCQSQEGYHMSHDQYLKGDLSLTITDVDYNKRTWYTCVCDSKEICDVSIQIASVNVCTNVLPGEPLSMDLPISEPVEVVFNKTDHDHPITVSLCNITKREIQCMSEYEKRVMFRSSMQLQEIKESDNGVYTIRDTWNDEVIGTYTVIVGVQPQVSLNPAVKVNLHGSATLPCSQTCSGLVTWIVFKKPRDILAQCDQTFCQSKEGFHMSHDQYLKGNISLTITDVDYTKRAWYTCECDGEKICDVSTRIEPFNYNVPVLPGESLTLDVPVSEPVEVVFNKTDHDRQITMRLCEIWGREIQCVSEYEKRVLFRSSLQLKEMNESDSGVYTIRDTRNEEVIGTYTVSTATVEGIWKEPDKDNVEEDSERPGGPGTQEKEPEKTTMWVLAIVSSLVLLSVVILMVLFRMNLQDCWLRMNPPPNERVEQQGMNVINTGGEQITNQDDPEIEPAIQERLLNNELSLSDSVPD